MTEMTEVLSNIEDAATAENWDRLEELWLEALASDPIPIQTMVQAARDLAEDGKRNRARTLLDLLVEAVEGTGTADAFEALRALVEVTDKPGRELAERLQRAFAAARSGSPSLDKVLDKYTLVGERRPLKVLATMECWLDHDEGTVVEVAGQGVGRVVDVNLDLENVKVDIGGRRPVSVPFGAVSRYLSRLPVGDFLRLKVEQPEELGALVTGSPGEALAQLLSRFDSPVDVATIKAALDGLLPAKSWNSWWAKARKHPNVLTSGSGSKLRYSVSSSAESATDALLDELEAADPRERLTIARRVATRGAEAGASAASFLAESLAELEDSDPGLAWETVGLLRTLPGGERPADTYAARILANTKPLVLFAGVQDRQARLDALQAVRKAQPDDWTEIWATWLRREEHPANLSVMAAELGDSGAEDALEASVESIFRNHNEHPAQLIWACETMTEADAPAALAARMTPSVLELIPDALTRKEYAPLRARAKALLDGGKVAVRVMLEKATEQQAQRFVQRVQRLDGVEPDRVRLVEQALQQHRPAAADEHDEAPLLVATRPAVDAKRAELKQLLDVEIPKTLKGINAAAAEGDLRENFEYHMLRDRQELQSARAAKLQQELATVRILEPGSADTSKVGIGTVVHLADMDGTTLDPVTILGAWDADIDRRIFANGSGLAQSLLGCSVGDTVQIEGIDARITAIAAWPSD